VQGIRVGATVRLGAEHGGRRQSGNRVSFRRGFRISGAPADGPDTFGRSAFDIIVPATSDATSDLVLDIEVETDEHGV
jgi:hypothetical protein